MLLEFSVENYRSFRDRATLSMIATSDKSMPKNLISGGMKDACLRSAAIYGANASGKSNFVHAMQFMKNLVLSSHKHQKGLKIRYEPFRMSRECTEKPSFFEVTFVRKGTKYVYGFSHNSEQVVEEHLFAYPKGRRAKVFTRDPVEGFKFTRDKRQQDFIAGRTLSNALYLSTATNLNYEPTSEAFGWFRDELRVVAALDDPHVIAKLISENPSSKEILLKALIEADVGISDVRPELQKFDSSKLPENMPKALRALLESSTDLEQLRVSTIHRVGKPSDGDYSEVQFDMSEESDGTERLFMLMGPWIDAIANGRTLVWDELDLRLHHLLCVFLVELFQDPIQNRNDAQLIFTTHNVNLLNSEILRRDQVWFTEKDAETGGSVLYSLVEFKPRKDKNLQVGYLSGRYGALPFIRGEKVFDS